MHKINLILYIISLLDIERSTIIHLQKMFAQIDRINKNINKLNIHLKSSIYQRNIHRIILKKKNIHPLIIRLEIKKYYFQGKMPVLNNFQTIFFYQSNFLQATSKMYAFPGYPK